MLAGWSGSSLIPRKIAGSEMSTIDESSVAMKMPSVVFDSAVHLYRSSVLGRSSFTAIWLLPVPRSHVDVNVVRHLTSTSILCGAGKRQYDRVTTRGGRI